MLEFLELLDPLTRTFWYIAIPTSIIFIIQTILTFVGVDATDGTEVDFDGDFDSATDHPFQLFSLRNLINFLLGFSWSGISFSGIIASKGVLIAVAFVIGILFVYVFFLVIQQILKLSEDNTFNIKKTVGLTAEVYLTIPSENSGKGKILLSVNGAVHEMNAITPNEALPVGNIVKVTGVASNELLIVEKLKN